MAFGLGAQLRSWVLSEMMFYSVLMVIIATSVLAAEFPAVNQHNEERGQSIKAFMKDKFGHVTSKVEDICTNSSLFEDNSVGKHFEKVCDKIHSRIEQGIMDDSSAFSLHLSYGAVFGTALIAFLG